MLHKGKSATMLPSIAASSSGHWNHEASRRWQRATAPSPARRTCANTSPRNASTSAKPSPEGARRGQRGADRPAGQARQHRLDQVEALADLLDPDPDARIDVARAPRRNLEAEAVVRRIGMVAARVEIAPRSAPDDASGPIGASEIGLQHAGSDRPVLQRSGVVVERTSFGKVFRTSPVSARIASAPSGARSTRDAARNDRVHHQPMAEGGLGGAQGPLAQDAAMGVHQGEGGVVADRADVADMIGDPLEFRHHAAKQCARGPAPRFRAPARPRARRRRCRRPWNRR